MTVRKNQLKKQLEKKIESLLEEKDKKMNKKYDDKDKDSVDEEDDDDEEKDDDDEEEDDDNKKENFKAPGSGELETDGGTKKNAPLKGKLKGKENPMKEKMMKEYEEQKKEIDKNVSDDIDVMLKGDENFSEEFKQKAKTIFETAIKRHVENEITRLEAIAEETINEQVEVSTDALIETIDQFLDHSTENYMKKNEVAIERGIKHELAEELLIGLKNLFEEYNVTIPDGKDDLVEELDELVEELEGKLDVSIKDNIDTKKELNDYRIKDVINELSDNLADTEKEKLEELAKGIEFSDKKSFRERLVVLKESYFKKTSTKKDDEDKVSMATDKNIDEDKDDIIHPETKKYLDYMKRQKASQL